MKTWNENEIALIAASDDLWNQYREVGRAVVITSGSRAVGFKSDRIVHRILKALLAAQVALSSFDRNVSEEKLDLFELTSCLMAEASTCSAQIVWSKPCQAAVRRSFSDD